MTELNRSVLAIEATHTDHEGKFWFEVRGLPDTRWPCAKDNLPKPGDTVCIVVTTIETKEDEP